MSLSKKQEVQVYVPQSLERTTPVAVPKSLSFERAGGSARTETFEIDERISDRIGLTQAKKDDEKKRFDAEVLRYVQKIKDTAFDEAYQKGLEEAKAVLKEEVFASLKEDYENELSALKSVVEQLQTAKERTFDEQKQEVIAFCYYMAEKIVRKEIERSPEWVMSFLDKLLEQYKSMSSVKVKIAPENLEFLKQNFSEKVAELQLEASEGISAGDVILEGEQGQVDARLATRLERLKSILEDKA